MMGSRLSCNFFPLDVVFVLLDVFFSYPTYPTYPTYPAYRHCPTCPTCPTYPTCPPA